MLILVPSAVATLRLRPGGRTGMLWFATVALAATTAQVLTRVGTVPVLWNSGGVTRGTAIWLASGLLDISVDAAYPVVVLPVLRSPRIGDAFGA